MRGSVERNRADACQFTLLAMAGPVVVIVVMIVVMVAVVVVAVVLRAAEVVFVDVGADTAAQFGAALLVEAEVDPAEDARVADVVGDLVEPGVVEDQSRHGGVRHGDGMPAGAERTNQHLGGAVAAAAVIRRVARETR